jgi:hypothetical protein
LRVGMCGRKSAFVQVVAELTTVSLSFFDTSLCKVDECRKPCEVTVSSAFTQITKHSSLDLFRFTTKDGVKKVSPVCSHSSGDRHLTRQARRERCRFCPRDAQFVLELEVATTITLLRSFH